MNEHLEWIMNHASFPFGETGEASQQLHGLVQYIERLKRMVASNRTYIEELKYMVASKDKLIENYQDANEEVTA